VDCSAAGIRRRIIDATVGKEIPVGKEIDLLVNYPRVRRDVEDRWIPI